MNFFGIKLPDFNAAKQLFGTKKGGEIVETIDSAFARSAPLLAAANLPSTPQEVAGFVNQILLEYGLEAKAQDALTALIAANVGGGAYVLPTDPARMPRAFSAVWTSAQKPATPTKGAGQ